MIKKIFASTYKDVLSVLCILLAQYTNTLNFRNRFDLSTADEAFYLKNGIGTIDVEWGPLYSIWYRIIHIFIESPIELYYTNMVLMTTIAPLLLYWVVRKIDLHWIFSLTLVISYVFSIGNEPYGIRVNLFLMIFLLASTLFYLYFLKNKPLFYQVSFFTLVNFFTSYIRVEQRFGLMILLGILIVLLIKYKMPHKIKFWYCISWGILYTIISTCLEPPFLKAGRANLAFHQDFSHNYQASHPEIKYNNWIQGDKIVEIAFGRKYDTMAEAFLNNPMILIKYHFIPNIEALIGHLYKYSFLIFKETVYINILSYPLLNNRYVKVILLLSLFYPVYLFTRQKITLSPERNSVYWSILLFLLLHVGLFIMASVYSFSKERYVLAAIPFIFVVIALVLKLIPYKTNKKMIPHKLLLLSAIGINIFNNFQENKKNSSILFQDRTNIVFLKEINRLIQHKENIVLYDNQDGFNCFLGWKNKEIIKFPQKVDFQKYITYNKITVILWLPLYETHHKESTSAQYFLKNYEKFNFKKIKNLNDSTTYVLLHKKIM